MKNGGVYGHNGGRGGRKIPWEKMEDDAILSSPLRSKSDLHKKLKKKDE